MVCDVSDEQLWSWVDRDARELAEHVRCCPACRQRATRFRDAMNGVARAGWFPWQATPSHVGPYRLRRLIGEGGQGWVFEAEQASPRRRVAVKLLKNCGQPDRHDLRLFEREVESLARLRHAGIVQIFEAGQTGDGQPYFAMEYVEGQPLGRTGDIRLTSLDACLDLFGRVCAPIVYAHQRGVIHRDLKPSNILVDDAGNPRVLDFGLARVARSDVTQTITTAGSRHVVGTLPYMSPEQAAGETEADVRADVYSLGVLLYELVTGRTPYQVSGRSPHEALRAIRDDVPIRPSSIRPALRGDLETIVLKAIDRDKEMRYANVAALAEDVRRFRAGEPILARPPTLAYQLRKLVARHRLTSGLAAALLLLVMTLGLVSSIQAARISRERDAAALARDDARAAATRAESTRAFLEELLFSTDPRWTDGEMNVSDLLAEAARRLDGWTDDAALEADLRELLGRTYARFGSYRHGALHLRAALHLNEQVHGVHSPEAAEACRDLANVLYGDGHRPEAAELYSRALEVYGREYGVSDPATLDLKAEFARLLTADGQFDRAERLLREVQSANTDAGRPFCAATARDLAHVLRLTGRTRAAVELYERCLAANRSAPGDTRRETGLALLDLGRGYQAAGDDSEALASYEQAVAVFAEPPCDMPNLLLARSRVADLHRDLGALARAIALQETIVQDAESAFPEWHYIPLSERRRLGAFLLEAGRFRDAEQHLLASLAGYRALNGDDHSTVRAVRELLVELRARRDTAAARDARRPPDQSRTLSADGTPARESDG